MSAVDNYLTALQRLIEGRPQNVPKGSAINKDTVALEAGRKRGSIKKCRAENADLIAEIEAAAAKEKASKPSASNDVQKQKALKQAAKEQLGDLKEDYELALQKIVSLAQENYLLKQQISELTAENSAASLCR